MDREQLTHMMEPPLTGAFSAHSNAPSEQLHTYRLSVVLNTENHLRLSADKRKRLSGVRPWPLSHELLVGIRS